ncbi:MAG: SPOR domain-containing protein [Saprospiraceae bacterium]|nr:SPOR domain-containing protein [Saprospiraceae bacterium]
MKNSVFLLLLLMGLVSFSCKSKKEMSSEPTVSKKQLERCENQIAKMKAQLSDKDAIISQLEGENQTLSNDISSAQKQLRTVTAKMQASSDDYGIWFRVQIGAYKNRQIDKNLETTDELSLEKPDDIQKVSLGRFRQYEDAKRLKNQLKGMGLKDAWIVSYKDGKRISIEEALKG